MLESCPLNMHAFLTSMSFFLANKFSSHWMVRKQLGTENQLSECVIHKQSSIFPSRFPLLRSGWHRFMRETILLASNGLFSIHFGWARLLWPSYGWTLSTLSPTLLHPLHFLLPPPQSNTFTRHQLVNHTNWTHPFAQEKWSLELLHVAYRPATHGRLANMNRP